MRRLWVVAWIAGCGFTAPAQELPGIDAPQGNNTAPSGPDALLPPDAPDPSPDAPAGPQCPSTYGSITSFTSATGSHYRFESTAAKWIDAETDCENDAAVGQRATHLIVLDDLAEKVAMIGGLSGGLNLNDQYVGATDLQSEGSDRYVTNQQSTLNLSPSSNANNKDCIRIKNNGGAEEYRSCDEPNRYVCECDGLLADPQRFPNLPHGNGD